MKTEDSSVEHTQHEKNKEVYSISEVRCMPKRTVCEFEA